MPVEGSIDSIDSRGVRGWAWDADSDSSCHLQILDGDTCLAEVKADNFREDLKNAGKGDGRCAFRFWFPSEIYDGKTHHIRVLVKDSPNELAHHEKKLVLHDPHDLPLPAFESPFYLTHVRHRLEPSAQEIADSLRDHGFAVLPGLISPEEADAIIAEAGSFFDSREVEENPRSTRLQDGWKEHAGIRQLASHPQVLKLLEAAYGRTPIPFQTLNFKYGTQQSAHSDRIHFSSLPEGFMCGVWVALEDVSPENGTLFYLKNSHREPDWKNHDLMWDYQAFNYQVYQQFIADYLEARGMEKVTFQAKKGDALIWSSQLIHGGSPVLRSDSTRWSQVTHYFFEDCIFYTPLFSDSITGEYFLRSVTNIGTGKSVDHRFNGYPVEPVPTEHPRRFRISFPAREE